ncbi:MAG: serine hydrolase [Candidatus Paceibacterota bacterium]
MRSLRSFFQKINLPEENTGIKALSYGVLVLAMSALILTTTLWNPETKSDESNSQTATQDEVIRETEEKPDPFKGIRLQAEAAYVLDTTTGEVLFEKNATKHWPLASITKVMTAMTALDLIPDHTVVTVDQNAMLIEGDNGLYRDEQWSLQDLLDFSLVTSSNSGSGAIASIAGAIHNGPATTTFDDNVAFFVSAMNQKAREIGLADTEFHNPHGLDTDEENSGSYSTARDTALMMEYALANYPDLLDSTRRPYITRTSLADITHVVNNTNKVVNRIPGVIASKTGYTDLSGGNLVVAFDAGLNHPIIVVVLGSGYDERFSDVLQLVNASIDATSDITQTE